MRMARLCKGVIATAQIRGSPNVGPALYAGPGDH
jgi:hypothetical protein